MTDTNIPKQEGPYVVTITAGCSLEKRVNLAVIAEYIRLDEEIIGIKYNDVIRGEMKSKPKTTKQKDRSDFKNQCTMIVNVPGEKNINVKLFTNGKLSFAGVKDVDQQVPKVIDIIVKHIHNLEGFMEYTPAHDFKCSYARDIYKKDIEPHLSLLQLLILDLGLDIDLEPFNTNLPIKSIIYMFQEIIDDEDQKSDILMLLTIIRVLKSYYDIELLENINSLDDIPFVRRIINGTDMINDTISLICPSYLGNNKIIESHSRIEIQNIMARLLCNFKVDRDKVVDILSLESDKTINYDKGHSSGVNVKCKIGDSIVTLIFFGSGKISISSAKSWKQVEQAYDYVCQFCKEHYYDILFEGDIEYQQKQLDDMPNVYPLGDEDGNQYVLLKKNHILKHPRNVYLLKKFNLLENYE